MPPTILWSLTPKSIQILLLSLAEEEIIPKNTGQESKISFIKNFKKPTELSLKETNNLYLKGTMKSCKLIL